MFSYLSTFLKGSKNDEKMEDDITNDITDSANDTIDEVDLTKLSDEVLSIELKNITDEIERRKKEKESLTKQENLSTEETATNYEYTKDLYKRRD